MWRNGVGLNRVLVYKYCNLTGTNVDLVLEIIVSGSLNAAKKLAWSHLVTRETLVKAKALKVVVRSSILKGKVYISQCKMNVQS